LSDWACGADERAYEEADEVSRHARLIVRLVNQLTGWPLKLRDERSSNHRGGAGCDRSHARKARRLATAARPRGKGDRGGAE
jgi:hypothetical protein